MGNNNNSKGIATPTTPRGNATPPHARFSVANFSPEHIVQNNISSNTLFATGVPFQTPPEYGIQLLIPDNWTPRRFVPSC